MENLSDLAAALRNVKWSAVAPMSEAEQIADHDRRAADPRDPFFGFPCDCAEVCQKHAADQTCIRACGCKDVCDKRAARGLLRFCDRRLTAKSTPAKEPCVACKARRWAHGVILCRHA